MLDHERCVDLRGSVYAVLLERSFEVSASVEFAHERHELSRDGGLSGGLGKSTVLALRPIRFAMRRVFLQLVSALHQLAEEVLLHGELVRRRGPLRRWAPRVVDDPDGLNIAESFVRAAVRAPDEGILEQ
jgi:hypothetical protein